MPANIATFWSAFANMEEVMRKPLLGALIVSGAVALVPLALTAQAPSHEYSVTLGGVCGSGLRGGGPECPPDRRLLIDLRRRGDGAPLELREVVAIGATQGGAFRLTPDQATFADSVLYAIIDVDRDASGNHRIETRAIGSGTTLPDCAGVSTGRGSAMTFGAILATTTAQLAQCAQRTRRRMTRQ